MTVAPFNLANVGGHLSAENLLDRSNVQNDVGIFLPW
jgi:hypothetical protein